MAELIPSRNSVLRRMEAGERRFSERIEKLLEDDYLCWYNVPVGPRQRQPDFLILHPLRGLLVLEVKNWNIETLRTADPDSVTLLTDHGQKITRNPLAQARAYAMEVVDLLKKDPALRMPEDSGFAGHLCMPYGWGVVLSGITRAQFNREGLGNAIEGSRVICKDEMTESVSAEAFQQRLWDCFKVSFPCKLTLPQIDRIRWHLFPEIRLPEPRQDNLFHSTTTGTGAEVVPDLIRIMDKEQERLARSLGDGHRVIHGVAGSGKTMILGYRSVHLARALDKPVLVLCYNVALAARLQKMIEGHGVAQRVAVRTFHAWCRQMLVTYHCPLPPEGPAFFDGLVEHVIAGVDRGQIPRAQYGAILIDEGHDFRADWFKLVAQMVDPKSNSLLVLYDDAQAINRRDGARFSFASVGIQARGRTRILHLNYRNTFEVLEVARHFAGDLLEGKDADEDGVPIVAPKSAGRHGPLPELHRLSSRFAEAEYTADRIQQELHKGVPAEQIGIVYQNPAMARAVVDALSQRRIPYRWAATAQDKKTLYSNPLEVKLVTMESSKGLEFLVTILPGVESPRQEDDPVPAIRLLYVAMTRAMERLVMTYSKPGLLTDRIDAAVRRATAS